MSNMKAKKTEDYTKKVFLGGTCNGSPWREILIPKINKDYFNPVVNEWDETARFEEMRQKSEECGIHLYLVNKLMKGCFTLVEAIDSAHDEDNVTIFAYQKGVRKNKMRISQFFSIDTAVTLKSMMQYNPELYEKIIRREPNADLAMMYWDTEMFGKRNQSRQFEQEKDYKKLLRDEMKKASQNPNSYPGYRLAKKLFSVLHKDNSNSLYGKVYGILIAGDPKERKYRSVRSYLQREKRKQYG